MIDISYTNGGGNGSLGDLQYAYDDLGRVVAKGGTFGATNLPGNIGSPSNPNVFNADNEMTSFNGGAYTMTYDNNGNVATATIGAKSETLSWDARNHLASLAIGANTASFTYDAFGRRALLD